jgi:2-oxoisovalerate dehydrogenase E1 component alpha subunit
MHKTIAQFSVEYVQYMDEQSTLLHPLPPSLQDPQVLVSLYQQMLFTRAVDAKAVALQRTGKMGTYPSSLGQEAIFIGMGHALDTADVLVPYYRDQGLMLMRGMKPEQLFRFWGGDERGSLSAAPYEKDFPVCIPIASQFLHAAGVAYAIQLRKEKQAVLVSGGDGSTSEGDFYEALNFAGLHALPMVFVINNNQWAISVSRDDQTGSPTLAQKAIGAGFTGIQVDGNDVIGVAHVIERALEKARQGGGPTLVEAITYRLCDHTTADDAKRYSDAETLAKAWEIEPILRIKRYLEAQGLWNAEKEQQLAAKHTAKIMQSVEIFLNTPPQPPTAIVDHMYEKWPAAWDAQREMLAAEKETAHV